jgi:hypothetical protein
MYIVSGNGLSQNLRDYFRNISEGSAAYLKSSMGCFPSTPPVGAGGYLWWR